LTTLESVDNANGELVGVKWDSQSRRLHFTNETQKAEVAVLKWLMAENYVVTSENIVSNHDAKLKY